MSYYLICLNVKGEYKWFMQKTYARTTVTCQEEGGTIEDIGGLISGPDNGCYWESLEEFFSWCSPDRLTFTQLSGVGLSAIIKALSPSKKVHDPMIVNYLRGYHDLHLPDYNGTVVYEPVKEKYETLIKEIV